MHPETFSGYFRGLRPDFPVKIEKFLFSQIFANIDHGVLFLLLFSAKRLIFLQRGLAQIILQPFKRLHGAGERDVSFARFAGLCLQQCFIRFLRPVKLGAQGFDHFIFRRLRVFLGLRCLVQLLRQLVELCLQFFIFLFQRDLLVLQGTVFVLQCLGI